MATISQVSFYFDLTPHHLRRLEKQGKIRSPERRANGFRNYLLPDICSIKVYLESREHKPELSNWQPSELQRWKPK